MKTKLPLFKLFLCSLVTLVGCESILNSPDLGTYSFRVYFFKAETKIVSESTLANGPKKERIDFNRFTEIAKSIDNKLTIYASYRLQKCRNDLISAVSSFGSSTSAYAQYLKAALPDIALYFDERPSFRYSTSHKNGVNVAPFFFHLNRCADSEQALFSAYYMSLHELAHIHMRENGLMARYSALRNEYWATRLANCSYLQHPSFGTINIFNPKFSESEQIKIDASDVSRRNASRLGAALFHQELYSITNARSLDKTDHTYPKVLEWCKQLP